MTIFLSVTDAIGRGSNHGITRVERKLALALAAHPDVTFAVMDRGFLWQIGTAEVRALIDRPPPDTTPRLERFGVDRAHIDDTRHRRLRTALARTSRRPADAASDVAIQPIRAERGDVLVSAGVDWTRGFLDAAERFVFGSDARYVGVCYDLIPIDHPEWIFPPDPDRFRRHFTRVTRSASTILCISEWTRGDFARHFPDYDAGRLKVLTLGSDAAVAVGPDEAAFAHTIFDGAPYAVYCATLDRRKNHQILYRAMREMVRRGIDGNLLFVGMVGSGVRDLLSAMRHDQRVRGRIAYVSNCDDRHLAALYAGARFAVYPSLYEGWGLGVTEALAHGKRSAVATGSSLKEASLGTAREVHPLVTSEWVEALADLFDDPALPTHPRMPSWDETAAQLVELVAR
jgi:glycosyltransferase involved in cell wall biosynthesis